MSSSLSFEGFILGQKEWKEKDKLLKIFTREKGKLGVLAKGVRGIESKRLGILETGSLIRGKLFSKSDWWILGDVELVFQPLKAREDILLNRGLFFVCGLIDNLIPWEEKNEKIFELMLLVLTQMEREENIEVIIPFEVKLLSFLGFGIPSKIREAMKKGDLIKTQRVIEEYLGEISEGRIRGLVGFLIK